MLKDEKQRVEHLRFEGQLPPIHEFRELARVKQRCLADLGESLRTDVARSREILRRLLGQITLKPREGTLVAVPSEVHRVKLGRHPPLALRPGRQTQIAGENAVGHIEACSPRLTVVDLSRVDH